MISLKIPIYFDQVQNCTVPKMDSWCNRRKPYSVQNYTQQSTQMIRTEKQANFDALGQNPSPKKIYATLKSKKRQSEMS